MPTRIAVACGSGASQPDPGRELLIADKGYASAELDDYLHARGADLLRPSYRSRAPRPGQQLLPPIRPLIESLYDPLKAQLDLRPHGGRTPAGGTSRVAQRLL